MTFDTSFNIWMMPRFPMGFILYRFQLSTKFELKKCRMCVEWNVQRWTAKCKECRCSLMSLWGKTLSGIWPGFRVLGPGSTSRTTAIQLRYSHQPYICAVCCILYCPLHHRCACAMCAVCSHQLRVMIHEAKSIRHYVSSNGRVLLWLSMTA